MGHEALAAIALHMKPGDYAFPYYRDRAFCLQRGMSDRDMALAFYAKRDSSSGGRQLTGHFSDRLCFQVFIHHLHRTKEKQVSAVW